MKRIKLILFLCIIGMLVNTAYSQNAKMFEKNSFKNGVSDATNVLGALTAGADYLQYMQADVTEDNAGNGNPDDPDDPDDGGWDWATPDFSHSTSNSPKNIYGATVQGLYYAYLRTGNSGYFIAMEDVATVMLADADIDRSSDCVFLMNFQDLPGVTPDIYQNAAKLKFDGRITDNGSATGLAEAIRDGRAGQGYENGIIPWDIGKYVVAAQMLADRFPSDPNDYAQAADDMAEVIYQDSYNNNPGYFDMTSDKNNGWDPTYTNKDYWWYTLGISGIIDAFKSADVHTDELADLITILTDCQYESGAISGSYGANTDDEDWQSSAYVVLSFVRENQANNQEEINKVCSWLQLTQDETSGGWVYSSGNHYPEVGGECTAALYFGDASEVWVNSTYTELGLNDGHYWGYDAFSKIQDAVDAVAEGGSINLTGETFAETGQFVIDHDMSIVGDNTSDGTTTIVPTANTGNSGDARGWFLVNDGIEFNISNVTLDGSGFDIYQAIRHKGFGTIDNVIFYEIKYPGYAGVAVAAFGGTDLNVHVSNSHFSEIGRVGVLYFGDRITGSNFTGNIYIGKGPGDWLDYCLDISAGANVTVDDCEISLCQGVASSDGSTSGAIMATTYYGDGTEVLITNCTLSNNTSGILVGYDEFDGSTVEAHFNTIVDNDYGVSNSGSMIVDATSNYWGDPTGPYNDPLNLGGLGNEVGDNIQFDPYFIDAEMTKTSGINIGLYETTCGDFEVRLSPGSDLTNTFLTNVQFTVKWPEATVDLINIVSPGGFNIVQQGSTIQDGGFNYAVFVGVPGIEINWTAEEEYTVLTFSHDETGSGTADFVIADDVWAQANNGVFYVELLGTDATGEIYASADGVFLGSCDATIKVLLQGPYNTTTDVMNTDINVAGDLPLDQPFNVAPWNYAGTESVGSFDATVVDWVLVELRTGTEPEDIFEQKAGLLLEDGEIAQFDDITHGIRFDDVVTGDLYYVVVWHRNHMPIMSYDAIGLPNATVYDFTVESNAYGYDTGPAAIELETAVFGMIAGDVTADGTLKYSGPANDRGPIIARIVAETGSNNINGSTSGYWYEDVNMNHEVLYIGTDNDRGIILTNLNDVTGTPYLNNVYTSVVPGGIVTSKDIENNDGPLDIMLNQSAGSITVELMLNDPIVDALMDNIQFTLAWKAGDNEIEQLIYEYSSQMFLIAQGDMVETDGIVYQVFASATPISLGQNLSAGDQLSVLSFENSSNIPIDGRLWIAEDDFASQNNATYFASIWGVDKSGTILTSTVGLTNPESFNSLSVYPNPVTNGNLNVTVNVTESQLLNVSIIDLQGKQLYKNQYEALANMNESTLIDVSELQPGVYLINVSGETVQVTDMFIVN